MSPGKSTALRAACVTAQTEMPNQHNGTDWWDAFARNLAANGVGHPSSLTEEEIYGLSEELRDGSYSDFVKELTNIFRSKV